MSHLINKDAMGQWSKEHPHEITSARMSAYKAAINQSGDDTDSVPVVYAYIAARVAMESAVKDFLPHGAPPQAVHGEHEFELLRPLRIGDSLRSRARVTSVSSFPRGSAIGAQIATLAEDGPVATQFARVFVAQLNFGVDIGDTRRLAPEPTAEPPVSLICSTDDDQAWRYGSGADDWNPIHTDPAAARSVGLPGVILQATCTLAIAAQQIASTIGNADAGSFRHLSVRFSGPVKPGETFRLDLWPDDRAGRFRAAAPNGCPVLSRGSFFLF